MQVQQNPLTGQNNMLVDDKTSPFDILIQETQKVIKQVLTATIQL